MKEIELILTDLGLQGIQNLQLSIDERGLSASGKLRNSFEVQVSESFFGYRMEIITNEGARYWQIVNAAERRPNKKKALKFIADIIYDWSKTKPINFADDAERKSFSYAVSQNINNGDYMYWQRERRKDFATAAFNDPTFMAAETNAVEQIANIMVDKRLIPIFKRPVMANE